MFTAALHSADTHRTIAPEASARGAVFLSYASQDVVVARRICETLRAAAIEVWFDQNDLGSGEPWDASIRRQIRGCALFVAIVSAHTQARSEGYFRREWKLAADRTNDMADGTPFLLPVTVDEVAESEARVPAAFFGARWTHLPNGEVPAAFVRRVKKLLAFDAAGETPARAFASLRAAFSVWTALALGAAVTAIAASLVSRPATFVPPSAVGPAAIVFASHHAPLVA